MAFKHSWIIFILISIFISSLVSAQYTFLQEANTNINLPGGTGFCAYAVNTKNVLTESISYTKCNLDTSLYGAVVDDFNKDGASEIIITQANKFLMYDDNCNLLAEQTLKGNTNARPSIINHNGDSYNEIVILNSTHLSLYQFNTTTSTFFKLKSMANNGVTKGGYYMYSCSNPFSTSVLCTAMRMGSANIVVFNISAGTTTLRIGEHQTTPYAFNDTSGMVYTRSVADGTQGSIPFCGLRGASTNDFRCAVYTEKGYYLAGSETGNLGSASTAISKFYWDAVFVQRMGSIERLFVSKAYEKGGTSNREISYVFDLSGNMIWRQGAFDSTNLTSNWMVADYDKDGTKEACILFNLSGAYLKCYSDPSFINLKYSHNYTNILNFSPSLTMADFYPDNGFLAIASKEGIAIYNSTTSSAQLKFETGATSNYYTDQTASIYATPTSQSPIYVYASNTESFVIRNSIVADLCGNGVCDASENEFSCQADCLNLTGVYCLTDADCPTNFPTCLENYCVSGYNASLTCNSDTDCPLTSPICFANYCVSGVSGGEGNVTTTATKDKEVNDAIRNSWNILTGGNSGVKLMLGLVVIIFLTVVVAQRVNYNPFITAFSAFGWSIVTTVMTLTPVAVPILIIVGSIILMLLMSKFSSSTA